MEIAADAAGIGIRESGVIIKIPLHPPLQKGEVKEDFLLLADLWRTAGCELAASLSLLLRNSSEMGHYEPNLVRRGNRRFRMK